MVKFDPLAPEIVLLVLGTPSKFQRVWRLGFVTAALSLNAEANQTLHDVWPSPGLAHNIYIFGSSCSRAAITLGIGPHSSCILCVLQIFFVYMYVCMCMYVSIIEHNYRMWAWDNAAQRDGRPAEHMWRLLFNAAKFG